MRPQDDGFPESLNASQGDRPPCAAYRQVLDALRELHPDDHQIARRMKDTRVPELGNQTLEEAVLAGDGKQALRYLRAISSGWNG